MTYCFVVRLVDGPAQQHGSSETEMASTDAPAPASAIASFAAATSIVGRVTGALSGGAAKRMEEVLCASALAFINADIDSNRKLDFEEFKNLVPIGLRLQHTDGTLEELFNMADLDSDGEVSQEEYFFWTLHWAAEHSGCATGVEDSFRRFDTTGDGQLNLREFTKAVDKYGFGHIGHVCASPADHVNRFLLCLSVLDGRKRKRSAAPPFPTPVDCDPRLAGNL